MSQLIISDNFGHMREEKNVLFPDAAKSPDAAKRTAEERLAISFERDSLQRS